MKFSTNEQKSAYYSRYFSMIQKYSKDGDFLSSDGKVFDESLDYYDNYETSNEFKSNLFNEMLEICRSKDIQENSFSSELRSLIKRSRARMPDDLQKEVFPHG